jgi:zeaxanthin glucosyltransferase
MEGKPMVAIPLAHDQPAVAARLARLGIAEVLPVMRLSAKKIHRAVTRLLRDSSYSDAAVKMQAKLHSLHGLQRAADVIEETLQEYSVTPRYGSSAGNDHRMDRFTNALLTPR